MTRKHFVALAEALAYVRPPSDNRRCRVQWELDVQQVANVCAEANAGFDRTRFFAACGLTFA